MQKIIYIAGLGHSGSTILDMAIGCNSNIVGLGEVGAMLKKKDKERLFAKSTCSCGKKGVDCDFWKDAKKIIESNTSIEDRYSLLIKYFNSKYGKDKVLLDSSKNSYKYLDFLNKNYELKVIYLTRDYRSWMYSRFLRKGKLMFYWGLRWYLENKKLKYVLKKYNIKTINIGYEELAFYPEFILKKISDFVDENYSKQMLSPIKTNSHIINGNIARTDSHKKQAIRYDSRWLTSWRLNLVSPFFLFLNRYNNKLVYSKIMQNKQNNLIKINKEFYIFGNKQIEEHTKKYDN